MTKFLEIVSQIAFYLLVGLVHGTALVAFLFGLILLILLVIL